MQKNFLKAGLSGLVAMVLTSNVLGQTGDSSRYSIRIEKDKVVERAKASKDQYQAKLDRERAELAKEQAERNRIRADRDKEKADGEKEKADRDKEQAMLEREKAERDRKLAAEDMEMIQRMIGEMVKDGLAPDEQSIVSITLNQDEFLLNGKKQPDAVHKKYATRFLVRPGYKISYHHDR
jgi:colicin import membrane protein